MAAKWRYPIGIQTFEKIREGNYSYIDKTGYVYDLAHSFQYVFLSRPRRFGKSLLVSTMKSYFEGRRDLFEGLEAGRLETEWRQHPVLQISLASAKGSLDYVKLRIGTQLEWLEQEYGIEHIDNEPGDRFARLIKGCYEKYGEKAVVLIDEYDAPPAVSHARDREAGRDTSVLALFLRSFEGLRSILALCIHHRHIEILPVEHLQ